ncbi:MAG: hypothetical protein GOVbin7744_24 [Prokaryotic dsDNA virus sp.]|nr:MAG: hypothetical protein GOVbin7744_24 [Prokaryotic dsDNA virus sp.]|tara:strand:+ start:8052 stop:9014 length:963 start_codon:yes stop_codon:yes gene_type:complete
MADNTTITAGTGTTIATDEIGGAHYQRVKVTYGADGSTTDVSDSNPLPIDDAGSSLTVDNAALTELAGAINSSKVDINISSGSIPAGSNTIGVVDLGSTDNAVLDDIASKAGSIKTAVEVLDNAITGSEMQCDVVAALPAGDNNIGNVDIASSVNLEVVGDVAHDAAAAGNPVQMGVRATSSVEGLTQVANADASFVASDLNGCIVTRPYTTLEEIITERVSNTNGNSTAFSSFGAAGSGIHNYITTISIYNSSSTDGYVDFRDGTGGSVIFTAPAPQTGGSVITFPVPLKFAANTAVAFDPSAAISTIYISLVGFSAQG